MLLKLKPVVNHSRRAFLIVYRHRLLRSRQHAIDLSRDGELRREIAPNRFAIHGMADVADPVGEFTIYAPRPQSVCRLRLPIDHKAIVTIDNSEDVFVPLRQDISCEAIFNLINLHVHARFSIVYGAIDGWQYCDVLYAILSITNQLWGHTMQYSFKDLEQLTGVTVLTLRQWVARGYIQHDGDGSGVKGDPCTFTEDGAWSVMWLAKMRAHGISADDALTLLAEAVFDHPLDVLVVTEEGHSWMTEKQYAKRSPFEDHPAFFAVSMHHFYKAVKQQLASFQEVKKMRNKIGFPTEGERMSLVH